MMISSMKWCIVAALGGVEAVRVAMQSSSVAKDRVDKIILKGAVKRVGNDLELQGQSWSSKGNALPFPVRFVLDKTDRDEAFFELKMWNSINVEVQLQIPRGVPFANLQGADDIKALLQQTDRMKAGAGGDIQNRVGAVLLENTDKEVTLRLSPCVPVDQAVPAVGEVLDVLLLIVISFTNGLRRITETLMIRLSGSELVLR